MQELLVFLIVAVAVGYLARQVWLSLTGKKSCCESGCGKTRKHLSTQVSAHLVQISMNGKTLPVQPKVVPPQSVQSHGVQSQSGEQNSSLN